MRLHKEVDGFEERTAATITTNKRKNKRAERKQKEELGDTFVVGQLVGSPNRMDRTTRRAMAQDGARLFGSKRACEESHSVNQETTASRVDAEDGDESLFINSGTVGTGDNDDDDAHSRGSRLNCDSLAQTALVARHGTRTRLARHWPLVGCDNLFCEPRGGGDEHAAGQLTHGQQSDCCRKAVKLDPSLTNWHKNKFKWTATATTTTMPSRRQLVLALSRAKPSWPALIFAATCLLHLMLLLSGSIVNQTSSLVINVNYAGRARSNQSISPNLFLLVESNQSNKTSSSWRYKRASSSSSSSSSSLSSKLDDNKHDHGHDNDHEATITSARGPQVDGRSGKLLEIDALNYLQRYGYMNTSGQQQPPGAGGSNALNLISEDSFHEAIMQFQRFAGIPETGSVDSLTVKYMQMPRCGNKDLSGKGENGKRKRRRKRKKRRRRRKRYALQGSKWRRQELTYRISQYPTRFLGKKHEVDGQIERAFKIWSQVAPIDFVVKKEGRVHIDIRFASGEHGDGDPFDGPGNTLAHAYFPQYGGDAHFDDQEYWTVDSYTGTNIFQVAAHELGHSLGLGHSSVREALMAPFYQKYKPNFKLHADDVLGVQALYGERADDDDDTPTSGTSSTTTSTTTTTTTTTEMSVPRRASSRPTPAVPSDDPDKDEGNFFGFGGSGSGGKPVDLCQDPQIDTITRTEDGNTYVFRGQYYWQIKNDGLASGFPAKISRDWDGLPGNLDAALTWSDGKTFFFKGDKYWRFFNKRREPGYPKQISVGFAGIPNNLDAAFVWSGNGKTYFFKRDKYWRFDSKQEPPVSGQYPKPIKNWSGLPTSGLDAAFKWENGMTYFFKDDLYYRFDDREFEVDSSARPAFPRSTAEWWFGCTNSNLPIKRRPTQPVDEDELGADNEAASSSVLMFHKKPNLIYDTAASNKPSSNGQGSFSSSSSPSLSRSIISSLSALFPSSLTGSSVSPAPSSVPSSSSSSSASSSLAPDSKEDWSFHRGLGEEVRRLFKSARSIPPTAASSPSRNPKNDDSRWTFPLTDSSLTGTANQRHHQHHLYRHHTNRGEESLSELRLAPPNQEGGGENEEANRNEATTGTTSSGSNYNSTATS